MSERDRDRYGSIVAFAVFVCLLIVAMIGWYQGFKRGQESHQSTSAEAYAQQANAEIQDSCIALSGVSLYECIAQAKSAEREQQRAEQNLDAQQQMAEWARWMLIVTVIMAAVTTFGVVFVWQTLKATQEMARDTRKNGKAQVKVSAAAVSAAREANEVAAQQFRASFKPWVSVDVNGPFLDKRHENPIRNLEDGEDQRAVGLYANAVLTNVGSIPATIEEFSLRLAEGASWPYVQNRPEHIDDGSDNIFVVLQSKDTIPIDPTSTGPDTYNSIGWFFLTAENRVDFMMDPPPVLGRVIYSDPLGVRYEHHFAFRAWPTVWKDSFTRYGGTEYNYEKKID